MEPVRPVTATSPNSGVETLPRSFAPTSGIGEPDRQGLDPAVTVELSADAPKAYFESERRGYVRDADSQALVYRVTDLLSGDVIVQIPDEVILKARAYTRQPAASIGERVEKSI